MKLVCIVGWLLLTGILLPLASFPQEAKVENPVLTPDFVFPPLEDLIDSAIAHSAMVNYRDKGIWAMESNLKSQRTYWTRNMGIQTDIRYGTFDNFSTSASEGQNPTLFASKSNQTNFGVGAYLKFPLYDLVNRKSQINVAKAQVDQAVFMAKAERDELRKTVIKLYNDLLLRQNLLRIKSKYLETTRINMAMVEKEFQNGVVSVTEYARISDIETRTVADFESARIDYITAYMLLEEMVGFKFNISMQ